MEFKEFVIASVYTDDINNVVYIERYIMKDNCTFTSLSSVNSSMHETSRLIGSSRRRTCLQRRTICCATNLN
jgi:hypothetical protein